MAYARIFNFLIPMSSHTDIQGKCTEYEIPLIKAKWSDHLGRDRGRKVDFSPMPEDGEHDPYRAVTDVDTELKRLHMVWGKKGFPIVYTLSQWERTYREMTIDKNPWAIEQARKAAIAEADAEGMVAAATAKHVHEAIKMRMEIEEKKAALIAEQIAADIVQSDKDAETLSLFSSESSDDDADLVTSSPAPVRKPARAKPA